MNSIFKKQLLLFILLLVLWNIFTPVLEGADESGHFCHAEYITTRGKLPDLTSPDGCFLVYQPLYYLSLSPIISIFGLPEGSYKILQQNPNIDQLRNGEYSQFVHSIDELTLRWDTFSIMIHLLRTVSSLFAVAVFLVAWKVSKTVFKNPSHRNLSMLLFFNPMFLHIFTTLTNVTLVTLIASIFIGLEIKFSSKKKPLKIIFFQGMLLGLGLLTKISILGLAPAYAWIFIAGFKNKSENAITKIREAGVFISGAFLVSGWYIARSLRLYGEPIEVNIARPYAGEHHWTLLSELGFLNFWNSFADTIFRTFWSGYGGLAINFPDLLNTIILLVALFTAYGIFRFRAKMSKKLKIALYYSLSIFIALAFVNIRTSSMHAKDLFTGYIPLALLFSFGLVNLVTLTKKESLPKMSSLFALLISGYFYTKYEIIRILKLLFQAIELEGFYEPETIFAGQIFLSFLLKIITLVIIFKTLIFLLRKFSLTPKTLLVSSFILFGANIVVLTVSVYLLYFKFL